MFDRGELVKFFKNMVTVAPLSPAIIQAFIKVDNYISTLEWRYNFEGPPRLYRADSIGIEYFSQHVCKGSPNCYTASITE